MLANDVFEDEMSVMAVWRSKKIISGVEAEWEESVPVLKARRSGGMVKLLQVRNHLGNFCVLKSL
jgi:hypothetical protein